MLEFFFWDYAAPVTFITGTHQLGLVVLSVVIAIITSCIAMQIAGIAQASLNRRSRYRALATGSLALGIGIWSMHFLGMLSFQLKTAITYDVVLTTVSIIPAILASWVALDLPARKNVSQLQLFAGGVLMGCGIGAMHYTGMAAMQMEPLLRYDPLWFLASVVVAILLAWFALWLRFGLKQNQKHSNLLKTLLSGSVMGLSVASMHYVAMHAARFIGTETPDYQHKPDLSLIFGISIAAIMLASLVLSANLFLRFKALYQLLRLSEARQKAIFDTAIDGVITIDREGIMLSVNPSVIRLFGWHEHELIGKDVNMLMPEPQHSQHQQYLKNYLQSGFAKIIGKGRETTAQRKDGSTFPIRLAVGEIRADDVVMFVGFITDISEQKRIEKLLEREATHDTLTDLPNRRFLAFAIPRYIARVNRSNLLLALLFIDLDGFKKVNDTLGHDTGDELLKAVANRLNKLVRSTDMVARLAGDEFVILLEGLNEKNNASEVAIKVLAELCTPMQLGQHTVTIGASIGIAFCSPGVQTTAEELIHRADQAMYKAKKRGKANIVTEE